MYTNEIIKRQLLFVFSKNIRNLNNNVDFLVYVLQDNVKHIYKHHRYNKKICLIWHILDFINIFTGKVRLIVLKSYILFK